MLLCPRCTTELAPEKGESGTVFVCAACRGRAATLPVLRKRLLPEVVNDLWLRARTAKQRSTRPCPSCHDGMATLVLPNSAKDTSVDVCERCQMAWFDADELEVLPVRPPTPTPEPLSPPAAKAYADLVASRQRDAIAVGLDPWDPAALAGVPTKIGAPERTLRPFVTWALATAMLGLTFIPMLRHGLVHAFDHGGDELHRLALAWGFIPDDPWRHGGLTLLTSFFLHGGVVHVVFNTYFLVLTGEDLESVLGRARLVLLLACATVLGDLVQKAVDSRSNLPSVGASGGIAGLFAYYAFALPKVRLGIALGTLRGYGWGFTQIRMPVGWVFGLWLALEVFASRGSVDSIAHGAHVGGALAGVAWWFVERRTSRPDPHA